ncbi:hypothetical protein RIF29_27680 [Crotalaria pallida]|uniref:Uncharacterized protein n=1 Tax=Crotalaria pallida TaxID=3830 RepID=A0AAN9I5U4_CROPI
MLFSSFLSLFSFWLKIMVSNLQHKLFSHVNVTVRKLDNEIEGLLRQVEKRSTFFVRGDLLAEATTIVIKTGVSTMLGVNLSGFNFSAPFKHLAEWHPV